MLFIQATVAQIAAFDVVAGIDLHLHAVVHLIDNDLYAVVHLLGIDLCAVGHLFGIRMGDNECKSIVADNNAKDLPDAIFVQSVVEFGLGVVWLHSFLVDLELGNAELLWFAKMLGIAPLWASSLLLGYAVSWGYAVSRGHAASLVMWSVASAALLTLVVVVVLVFLSMPFVPLSVFWCHAFL